ncbi:hypothetical protein DOY81_012769, partial [Sarcophaga bullata]
IKVKKFFRRATSGIFFLRILIFHPYYLNCEIVLSAIAFNFQYIVGFPDDIDDFDDAMDFWGIFVMFFLLAFIIMSCCGFCCTRKQRGAVLSAPVVVTSATHTAPGGYPVTQMPVGTTTTAYQTQVYATPYPPQGPNVIYVVNPDYNPNPMMSTNTSTTAVVAT